MVKKNMTNDQNMKLGKYMTRAPFLHLAIKIINMKNISHIYFKVTELGKYEFWHINKNEIIYQQHNL